MKLVSSLSGKLLKVWPPDVTF